MQYQIPQEVEVADKIIGPFTLKQFLYLISGVGFGLGIYAALRNTVIPTIIVLFLALIPVGIFALVAFIKVNGRPMDSYISPFFGYMGASKKRFWQRETVTINQGEEIQKLRDESEKNKNIVPDRTRGEISSDIANLATLVDTGTTTTMAKEPKTIFEIDEERHDNLTNLLREKAIQTQGQREPLVSQLASVSPNVAPQTINQAIPEVKTEEKINEEEARGQ